MVVDDMDALPPAVSGVTPAGAGMGHDEGAAQKRLDAIIIEVDAQTPTDEKWARSAATARLVEDALDQEPARPGDQRHDLGEVGFAGGEPPVRRCAAAAKASGVSAPPEQAPPAACCVGQQPGRRSAGSPQRMRSRGCRAGSTPVQSQSSDAGSAIPPHRSHGPHRDCCGWHPCRNGRQRHHGAWSYPRADRWSGCGKRAERLSVRWSCGTPPSLSSGGRPEGLGSQVLGQGREAFAAKNHADMLPPRLLLAAADHDEVTRQMRERLPCNHYAQFFGMGEVGPTFEKRGPCIPAPASGGR